MSKVKTAEPKELTLTTVWVSCPYCNKSYEKVEMLDDGIVRCPNCRETFRVVFSNKTGWLKKCITGNKFEELKD